MIPCCFHPTRVVIISNSKKLTSILDEKLPKSHMTFDYFNNGEQALHYMNEVYQSEPFYDRYNLNNKQGAYRSNPFKSHILDTYLEIYRPQRFDEISTIVMDCTDNLSLYNSEGFQSSNQVSCLDYFMRIKNSHIQRIMLVEEGNEHIASKAVENGLISNFISKKEDDWGEHLSEILQDAQWQYFTKLSEIFMSSFGPGVVKEYAIDDPHFQKLFKTILVNNGFTEAYLCEATGSYLFLDGQAQDHGLVVNFADQLDQWVQTGKDKGVELPLLKALKDRKKMMCYHTSSTATEPDKNHWEIYAHPAKTIQGQRNTLYYALAPNMYDIDVERILPFEEYRENHQRKASRLH